MIQCQSARRRKGIKHGEKRFVTSVQCQYLMTKSKFLSLGPQCDNICQKVIPVATTKYSCATFLAYDPLKQSVHITVVTNQSKTNLQVKSIKGKTCLLFCFPLFFKIIHRLLKFINPLQESRSGGDLPKHSKFDLSYRQT